jgi:hypothetical protein
VKLGAGDWGIREFWILDFGLRILDFKFQILDLNFALGLTQDVFSGCRLPSDDRPFPSP